MVIDGDLRRDGYAVVRGLLSPEKVAQVREMAEATFARVKIEGDLAGTVDITHQNPLFRELIRHAPALAVLREYGNPYYFGHAVIHKPRQERRRNWHMDWWGWADAEASGGELPPQVGILYYLQDTGLEQGCLTVLPGSHRSPGDEQIHSLRTNANGACPGEVLVPVQAGDGILLDARCWHASQRNEVLDNRICLTLWYLLQYERLSPEAQAHSLQGVEWLRGLMPEMVPPPTTGKAADYQRVSMPEWWA